METRIKNSVLDVLKRGTAQTLSDVINNVSSELRVSKAQVKAAIWELYADGLVQLTADWDLKSIGNAMPATALR